MPLAHQIFNYDGRGGLPSFQWGMLLVNLISYFILLMVTIGAIFSLIKGLNNPSGNRLGIIESCVRLIIIVSVVMLPKVLDDKHRFSWYADDLNKVIKVKIGGTAFVVPIKHLDGTWKEGEEINHLGLVALLPNFEGRSIAKKEEFTSNKNGIGSRIRIYLDINKNINPVFLGKFGDLNNKALYFQYYKSNFGVTDETKPISSDFNLNYMGDLRNKELYISKNGNNITYYRCGKDPEDGKVFFPACETKFPLWGDVVLKYRFNKKYLKEWEAIHSSVWKFVSSMEIGSNKKLPQTLSDFSKGEFKFTGKKI